MSLDLTGLPPTPQEVAAFVVDDDPGAYERLVDRLLASPHYGERWASLWLDAARYADTNGYEKDLPRSIWPYRDWVIDAINRDQPFDDFTIEQIAGDLLPGATLDQRVATGFHRNTMINQEGGIDVAEDRFKSVVDRVKTTGSVFLGLTLSCAQCHTHKYDPITQREYYRFFAFFNNADEIDVEVATPATEARRTQILRDIASLEGDLERRWRERGGLDEAALMWETETVRHAVAWRAVAVSRVVSRKGATLRSLDDDSVLASGDSPNTDIYDVEFRPGLPTVTAVRLEALPHASLPDHGPGRALIFSRGDFFLSEVALERLSTDAAQPLRLKNSTAGYTAKKSSPAAVLDGKLDTGWSIKGRASEPHACVLEVADPLGNIGNDALRLTLTQQNIHQLTLGRFRLSITDAPLPVRATGVPADIETILLLSREERSVAASATLKRYFLATVAPELEAERKELAKLRKEHRDAAATTMAFVERSTSRATYIRHRGEFLQPRERVSPGVLSVLHDLPSGVRERREARSRAPSEAPSRLTVARWLVSPENPLVARVIMNRNWAHLFGRGIVATVDDFGVRGEPPTHAGLLDWLACEFMERGWGVKEMHRLIVTSATYRQRGHVSLALAERDPNNELLARGARLRLSAEQIRDLALSASGLLTHRLGGPSVFLPQPENVTRFAYGRQAYRSGEGASRYRRGLYSFWKRTAPYAGFMTFDAPSREEVCVRRVHTNTPLQALTLLNDVVFVEAAQALARRVLDEAGQAPQERLRRLYLLVVGREPSVAETEKVLAYYRTQRARVGSGEVLPEDLIGQVASTESQDAREALAAWVLVCRALLNLDETITRG